MSVTSVIIFLYVPYNRFTKVLSSNIQFIFTTATYSHTDDVCIIDCMRKIMYIFYDYIGHSQPQNCQKLY